MLAVAGLRQMLRAFIALSVMGTALALLAASTLDLGPAGDVRISLFPFVLTSFDPFVLTCLGHSLSIAVFVALGSRLVGFSLGRLLYRSRFPGRRLRRVLFLCPVIFPTAFLALGLGGLIEFEPVAERRFHDLNRYLMRWGIAGWTWNEARGWLGWGWIGLVQGVGMIFLVLDQCLDRIDPAWEDAARLAGMSERAIWKTIIRPVIRARLARAVGLVFCLNLVEVGIPLIFEIRRAIGFQVVELSSSPDPFPRLSAIALLTVGCIAAGSLLIRIWVGPSTPAEGLSGRATVGQPLRTLARPWPIECLAMLVLLGWLVLTWLPIFGLARLALQGLDPLRFYRYRGSISSHPLFLAFSERRTARLAINSLAVGIVAATLTIVFQVLRPLARVPKLRPGYSPLSAPSMFPPILLGVATLALPRILDLSARGLRRAFPLEGLADALERLSSSLDPTGFPLRLLLLVTCLEVARRSWSGMETSPEGRMAIRDRLDAARLFGVKEFRANRLARRLHANFSWPNLVLLMVIAGTRTSPAIILGPTAEGRTITPGIIALARESGDSHPRAAGLALGACMILMVGWIFAVVLADRRKDGVPGLFSSWCDLDERPDRP